MEFIRRVTLDEVLAATPDEEATRAETRRSNPYGLWRLAAADLQSVGAQHPDGTMDTIAALFPSWLQWLESRPPDIPAG
jgi:hypothetical protein